VTRRPGPAIRPRRVVGVASILLDRTVDVPGLPPRGGDVIGADAGAAPGGGINTLSAARRLGLAAVYAAPHGTGPAGDAVREALAADGIEALQPPEKAADTGYCLALLEPDGERTFVTVPGVEARQSSAQLARIELTAGDAVYASGYDLAYPVSGPPLGEWLGALPAAGTHGPWLILDPGPLIGQVNHERLAAVLARTDLLSASVAELAALGGRERLLAALPPVACVIVRDGANGCVLLRPDADDLVVRAVAPPGPVVDTNGAGDVHLGAVLAGLARGDDWIRTLALAARAAAWSLTRRGAASGPFPGDLASPW
jgi:ribokinase